MSRASILATSVDLQDDQGSVLWSFVRGEQLEFPISLNFLANASGGYVFEAVIVEALNVIGEARPTVIRPAGKQNTLVVRVLTDRGIWSDVIPYTREEFVYYAGLYYKLTTGIARVSATTPDLDPAWVVHNPNTIYVQFPSSLLTTPPWSVLPTTEQAVYGFFELRVTEPAGGVFTKTWKPMRGMIEVQFSPTELVVDV